MKINVSKNEELLGVAAAEAIAEGLKAAIAEKGEATFLASTGSSQFTTFVALLARNDVDWTRVTMYHLDEYVALPESHIASFRKYLKERFVSKIPLKRAVFVGCEDDKLAEHLAELEREFDGLTIDVGAIGIGENAHIAFNDPPAQFDKAGAYHVVNLNDTCKQQQVNEGWFATLDDVPKQAISMTPGQIMKCKKIVSAVPGPRKAQAIYNTLTNGKTDPMVPATLLLEHPNAELYLDEGSASMCTAEILAKHA